MSQQLKVSVITINYNNAEGLRKTINSVLRQTYGHIQYLVIDGDSTDGSKAILTQFKEEISYAVSEPDAGIYQAMNKGIRAAGGDYLLFLNSGDSFVNDTAIADSVADGLTTDLVSANLRFIENGSSRTWTPPEILSFDLFYKGSLPHPSTFIKKELFEVVGLYNESLDIISDWEFFFLAAIKHNCSYKHINVLLAEFTADGISSDPRHREKLLQEREQVLSKNFSNILREYEELEVARKQLRKLRYTIKIKKFLGIR